MVLEPKSEPCSRFQLGIRTMQQDPTRNWNRDRKLSRNQNRNWNMPVTNRTWPVCIPNCIPHLTPMAEAKTLITLSPLLLPTSSLDFSTIYEILPRSSPLAPSLPPLLSSSTTPLPTSSSNSSSNPTANPFPTQNPLQKRGRSSTTASCPWQQACEKDTAPPFYHALRL